VVQKFSFGVKKLIINVNHLGVKEMFVCHDFFGRLWGEFNGHSIGSVLGAFFVRRNFLNGLRLTATIAQADFVATNQVFLGKKPNLTS
jgi:hypothetical protein